VPQHLLELALHEGAEAVGHQQKRIRVLTSGVGDRIQGVEHSAQLPVVPEAVGIGECCMEKAPRTVDALVREGGVEQKVQF
jgi:hypothetical protein